MASSRPTAFIDFEIVGNERGVQRMLNTIDSALSPIGLAAFLAVGVGPYIKQRAVDRFHNQGDDVSGTWAPLKETTVAIREGYGLDGSSPINKRWGELEQYITQSEVGVTAAPGVGVLKYPQNEPKSAGLRTKVKTAQQGRMQPKTVPRPVLGLNENDLGTVMTMLAFHIQGEGRWRGAGGR